MDGDTRSYQKPQEIGGAILATQPVKSEVHHASDSSAEEFIPMHDAFG
jgi:hypothetical protein